MQEAKKQTYFRRKRTHVSFGSCSVSESSGETQASDHKFSTKGVLPSVPAFHKVELDLANSHQDAVGIHSACFPPGYKSL